MTINPKKRVRQAIRVMRNSIIASILIMVFEAMAAIALLWAPGRLYQLADLIGVSSDIMRQTIIEAAFIGVMVGAFLFIFQFIALYKSAEKLEEILDDVPTNSQADEKAPTEYGGTPKVTPSASE